jgi:hypothetical protein
MKEIKLTQGKFALVDDEDFEFLNKNKWHVASRSVSRCKTINKREVKQSMHRLIMNAPSDKEVDHINHNFLDNRKSNLRLCTRSQNMGNIRKSKTRPSTSIYKGVFYNNGIKVHKYRKWQAQIMAEGKRFVLGTFLTEVKAAKAYNIKAKELFGEFALVNRV